MAAHSGFRLEQPPYERNANQGRIPHAGTNDSDRSPARLGEPGAEDQERADYQHCSCELETSVRVERCLRHAPRKQRGPTALSIIALGIQDMNPFSSFCDGQSVENELTMIGPKDDERSWDSHEPSQPAKNSLKLDIETPYVRAVTPEEDLVYSPRMDSSFSQGIQRLTSVATLVLIE
jgi:hypothetical protein